MIKWRFSSQTAGMFFVGLLATSGLFFGAYMSTRITSIDYTHYIFLAILVPLTLLAFHHRHTLAENYQSILVGIIVAIIVSIGILSLNRIRSGIASPRQWDFLSFWLNGQVAVAGHNFYDPVHYEQFAQSLKLSESFVEEIVQVGFWYPPPSMFLFVPLGWFEDVNLAMFFWYIGHGIFLLLDIYLLWRMFFHESGILGLSLTTMLLLALLPTTQIIWYSQTNFVVLFLVLLAWHDRDKPRAGIWLALGLVVKPFVAGLMLYLLIKRHWRALANALIVLIILSLMTVFAFGIEIFTSYLSSPPTARFPSLVYTEGVNQSLLATILRFTQTEVGSGSPIMNPLYLVLAAILLVITVYFVFSLKKPYDHWAFVLNLLFILLVYPASLTHYAVLLILPMLVLWKNGLEHTRRLSLIALWIGLTWLVMSLADGNFVFFATLMNWFLVVFMGWQLRGQQPSTRVTQSEAVPG